MSRRPPSAARALLACVIAVVVAALVGWAASQGGAHLAGVPLLLLGFGVAFAVQWIAFVPAFLLQSERFYDLTGSLTYLTVTWGAVLGRGTWEPRGLLLAGLVSIWALRLGSFLFLRIRADGKDGRFDDIKPSAPRFLMAWTLQGLWVSLTLAAALAAITSAQPAPLGVFDLLGLLVWGGGFAVEVVADRQKRAFRAQHPERFIDAGLWAWSRHPNYFGEIVLWCGVALIAASTLQGWAWITLISPLFVAFLLTRVSGVPLLEQRADARWGHREDYQRYKARTPVLLLKPPR